MAHVDELVGFHSGLADRPSLPENVSYDHQPLALWRELEFPVKAVRVAGGPVQSAPRDVQSNCSREER